MCGLQYLGGECTPYMDTSLTETFRGLTLRHDRAHIVRAANEGITCALYNTMECISSVRCVKKDCKTKYRLASGGMDTAQTATAAERASNLCLF